MLASFLTVKGGKAPASGSDGALRIPNYSRWRLEEEATTYRPGSDLQFYTFELKSYTNPSHSTEKVVELRRDDILYYYTFAKDGARWNIYMDAGFAKAPCGFFDPEGEPTGRFISIDLACLRET